VRFKLELGEFLPIQRDTRVKRLSRDTPPVKRHRGEPGHTRDARAHTGTRITQTNLPESRNPKVFSNVLAGRCRTPPVCLLSSLISRDYPRSSRIVMMIISRDSTVLHKFSTVFMREVRLSPLLCPAALAPQPSRHSLAASLVASLARDVRFHGRPDIPVQCTTVLSIPFQCLSAWKRECAITLKRGWSTAQRSPHCRRSP